MTPSFLPPHLQLCIPRGKLEESRDRKSKQGVEGEKSQLFPAASLAISWLNRKKSESFKMHKNMEVNDYDWGNGYLNC